MTDAANSEERPQRQLRLGRVIRIAEVTLWPVERIRRHADSPPASGLLVGIIEPIAIVVQSSAGVKALDLGNRPLPLRQLLHEIPELVTELRK